MSTSTCHRYAFIRPDKEQSEGKNVRSLHCATQTHSVCSVVNNIERTLRERKFARAKVAPTRHSFTRIRNIIVRKTISLGNGE